jgi:soluble lytic murein transglycosylase-like protein
VDAARRQMQIGEAGVSYRDAIRNEQVAVYKLAGDQSLGGPVLSRLGPAEPGLSDAVAAIRSQWVAYGTPVLERQPNQGHRFLQSEPVAALLGYYQAAGAQVGVDWSYLAAINYMETDFGRNDGPSAAGAQGPMQFLPTTWAQVGGEGDIRNPHDAIFGAARFLRSSGAPASYQRAVFAYDNDQDYVDAVSRFAAALRADPLWLTRLYYWNTYG